MIVIADATVLINLAKIELFFILKQLFDEVLIARSVYDEVVAQGKERYGAQEVKEALWIRVVDVNDTDKVQLLLNELDLGESESIVVALEQQADLILIDEIKAREIIKRFHIRVKGTLGVLLEAYRKGIIPDYQKNLDTLIRSGTWISKEVYNTAVRAAKEK